MRSAIDRVGVLCGAIRARSRLFRTSAVPSGSGPDFVNAAFSVATDLSPDAVLKVLHDIEADHGRRRNRRWAPRTLDLDLLAFDCLVRPDLQGYRRWADLPASRQQSETPDELVLPHPRLHERAFVLVPLMEVAPGWRHPVKDQTVTQMCTALAPWQRDGIAELR